MKSLRLVSTGLGLLHGNVVVLGSFSTISDPSINKAKTDEVHTGKCSNL